MHTRQLPGRDWKVNRRLALAPLRPPAYCRPGAEAEPAARASCEAVTPARRRRTSRRR